jgi:YaiO family outer membrane protein
MKLTSGIITFLLLFTLNSANSQEADLEKMFQEARTLAFANNYISARKICHQILQKNNRYFDARILLARTFSWDHKFDSARFHLRAVLRQDPYLVDAYLALADAETWSSNCAVAVTVCDTALSKIPNNYELFIKKIKACLCTSDGACAQSTIDSLLKVHPMNIEVMDLMKQTRQGSYRNRLIVEHSFEFFRQPYVRRWHVTSLQYQRDGSWGTAIAKVNAGQLIPSSGKLFDPGAIQYEADFYPLLGKGYYAYLNYGFSDGELFPQHRAGLELFKTFPRGIEVSLGGRYLYFNELNDVLVYTGSFSKYHKSWWFSARPYISVINEEWFQSYFLFARKYSTQYNYVGGMVGYGLSPDYIPNMSGTYEIYNLNSYQARFDIQHRIAPHFLLRSLTGYAYDQYLPKEYRHRFNAQIYLAYMF